MTGGDGLIFRLRAWPRLSPLHRTANTYRLLSVMSNRPVNGRWLHQHSKMSRPELDRFLAHLVDCGAVDVIDPSAFPIE